MIAFLVGLFARCRRRRLLADPEWLRIKAVNDALVDRAFEEDARR